MSPLIHKSLTWAIVSSVVLIATWLANNVQDAHDQRGFRLRMAQQGAASATSANDTPAFRVMPTVAEARLQGAPVKR